MAGHIYKLCAKHTSNSGFDRAFMPCSGYFNALPNNEQGTKHRGLTYCAKQTVREICKATYSASQTRLRIYLTVSITVVQSIETPKPPKNTPNHQKHLKLPPNPNHYHIYSQYHIMRDIFRTLMAFSRVGALGLVLTLCNNTYRDRAERPPASLKS